MVSSRVDPDRADSVCERPQRRSRVPFAERLAPNAIGRVVVWRMIVKNVVGVLAAGAIRVNRELLLERAEAGNRPVLALVRLCPHSGTRVPASIKGLAIRIARAWRQIPANGDRHDRSR